MVVLLVTINVVGSMAFLICCYRCEMKENMLISFGFLLSWLNFKKDDSHDFFIIINGWSYIDDDKS